MSNAADSEAFQGTHWPHIARLVPSFGVAQGVQALTGFLVARLLFPQEYGLWSLFAVVLFYSAQLHLGAINLMHKEVPFFLAAKDAKAAEQVTNFAFSLSLTNSVLAAAGIAGVGLLWRPAAVTWAQVILLACLVVAQELFTFVNYWLRAYQRFAALGRFLTLYACCNLALLAGLAWWRHLTGVLLAYIITSSCVALCFVLRERIRLAYRCTLPRWKNVGQASQLLLWTMMFVFLTTLDRLFIGWRLGILALGLFGVSLLLSNLIYNTADVVLQVLFPAASSLAGSSHSRLQITHLLMDSAQTLSYVLAAILGLGFLLLPALVPILLPRYSLGIPAARVVCLGLAPLVLAQLISVGLVVTGRLALCLLLQATVLLAKALLLLSLQHPQLTSIALISSAANILYFLAISAVSAPASAWNWLKSLAGVAAPWLLTAAVLLFVSAAKPIPIISRLGVFLPSSLYIVLAPPLLWAAYRNTRGALHV